MITKDPGHIRHRILRDHGYPGAAVRAEGYEASEVLVTVQMKEHPGRGHDFNRRIIVSTSHAYPVGQADGRLVIAANSGLSIIPFGHGGGDFYIDEQRIY
jgi:hypothetical protein